MPTLKTVNKKYGRPPAKIAGETPWNKLCVDLIGPYKIRRKGKYPLLLKVFTDIYPVTEWFEVKQCSNKRSMAIVNFVETMCLVRYLWTVEIRYDQGGDLLGNEFINSLIENEYGIKTKPDSPGNPQEN